MGNRTSSYSSSTQMCLYDQRAAAQAGVCHQSDFTSPEFLVNHLLPGDLIQKKGNAVQQWFYSHWAIYIGNGEIVHVTPGVTGVKAGIVRSDMVIAFEESSVRKNNHMDEHFTPMSVQRIIQRARGAVGTPWKYNFLTNNCEHFASWCRYNRKVSLQSFGIFDVIKGRVSFTEYMTYHMKPVIEKCQTFFSWIKRKVCRALEGVAERHAISGN